MIDASTIDNINTLIGKNKNTAAGNAAGALSKDFDQFLLLLTTQLKNQDPTAPMDTNTFTQQIVSFTGVEQAIATNRNLEQLIGLVNNSQISNVVSYIGRDVEASGNQGMLIQGQAAFIYNLEREAATAEITISDATGRVVFAAEGSTLAGRNQVIWDGTNSFTGEPSPEGVYTISVAAKDAQDNEIEVATRTFGRVSAIDMQNGSPILSLGDIQVPLDEVLAIRDVTFF